MGNREHYSQTTCDRDKDRLSSIVCGGQTNNSYQRTLFDEIGLLRTHDIRLGLRLVRRMNENTLRQLALRLFQYITLRRGSCMLLRALEWNSSLL